MYCAVKMDESRITWVTLQVRYIPVSVLDRYQIAR